MIHDIVLGTCVDKYIQLNDIDNQVDGISEGKEVSS